MASNPEATQQAEPAPRDTTFRNYSSAQASTYAKGRFGYPEDIIKFIVNHHVSTGGGTKRLLDAGCGPGLATRALAVSFDEAIGADAGEAMIQQAIELGGTTATGALIEYKLCAAEDLDKLEGVEHGSVDLITVATAVHWFHMPKFWAAAAKILKNDGSVMIWGRKFRDVTEDNPSQEDARIRQILKHWNEQTMSPYLSEGNRLANSGYQDLLMPWDEPSLQGLFDKDRYVRREFFPDEAQREVLYKMFEARGTAASPLSGLRMAVETFGSVTRWREQHPELVGTPDDCVNLLMKDLEAALEGADRKAQIMALMQTISTVVICVKRSKAAEA